MASKEQHEEQQRRIGTTLAGKYMLVRLLGVGGMGSVYEAENAGTGRRVAVKVMHPAASADPEMTARFLREARASTRVAHPNIVDVLDLDRDTDGTLYIVQEFLVGKSLRELITAREGKPFPPQEAFDILLPVMHALVAVHAQKVVHRDLKPDNVFLAQGADGRVMPKLIDFGIAKLIDDEASLSAEEGGPGLTRTGTAMGTPHYMSPEQARGVRSIDAQTDVWAIGVVLYEMLTGRRPFHADNYNALMVSILADDPPRVDTLRPGLPSELADVVAKALAREREHRFATMEAFADAMGALVTGSGPALADTYMAPHTTVPRRPATEMALGETISLKRGPRETSDVSAAPKRSRGRAAWILVAVATVGGVAAWGALRWPEVTRAAVRSATSHPATPPAVPHVPTTPAAVPAIPQAPVAPPPPRTFHVLVRAEPAAAVVSLDGADGGANPLAEDLPRDGRPHHVTASAPGYVPRSIAFQDAAPPGVITLAASPPPPAAPIARAAPPPLVRRGPAPTPHVAPHPAPAQSRAHRPARSHVVSRPHPRGGRRRHR